MGDTDERLVRYGITRNLSNSLKASNHSDPRSQLACCRSLYRSTLAEALWEKADD